jgi:hypothetical protein
MSIDAIKFVRETYKQISVAKKFLLTMIAERCDDPGFCYPSVATLADDCCMSERYVQKLLKELVASGDLAVDVNCGLRTPKGFTNVYYLVKYRQQNNITSTPQDLRVKPANDGVNNGTPQNNQGVNNSSSQNSKGVNNDTPLNPQGVNYSAPKPLKEKELNTIQRSSALKELEQPVVTEEKAPVTTEQKKASPITDVTKALDQHFGIVGNFQLAHIIMGTYKNKGKRKTEQTIAWAEITERFAEEPATAEMIAEFAKWYKGKYNGLSLKSTPSFLNHYSDWYKNRQSVQKRNPVTPMVPVVANPYGDIPELSDDDALSIDEIIAATRKRVNKGENAA